MSRRAAWSLGLAMALLVGYVIYGSMARVRVECELCVEFNGRTECRKGAGADEQEARRAAQVSACGVLAFGMDESIRCENRRPTMLRCTGS